MDEAAPKLLAFLGSSLLAAAGTNLSVAAGDHKQVGHSVFQWIRKGNRSAEEMGDLIQMQSGGNFKFTANEDASRISSSRRTQSAATCDSFAACRETIGIWHG
jgi:hypothetical protein